MEKTILTTVFSILLGTVAFSQSTRFLKRVENNYSSDLVRLNGKPDGYFNLDSKTEVEKLFFGDINAGIEFYVSPSTEANYGFRILKKPSDGSYTLEVKRISNWKEVETELREEFPWQRARLLDRSFQGNGTARESARRRRNDIPVCRRRRRMDADRQQDRRKHPRTVRSVQTNHRRRGSGPIRRIEVYRTAGRLRAGGLQLRQSKKLPGSQAYCKRRSPRLFI